MMCSGNAMAEDRSRALVMRVHDCIRANIGEIKNALWASLNRHVANMCVYIDGEIKRSYRYNQISQ